MREMHTRGSAIALDLAADLGPVLGSRGVSAASQWVA